LSIFDGVVTLDDNHVAVIIGLEETGIRMSSGGAEIGVWSEGEYSIHLASEGVYKITAENETLTFVPSNPMQFAASLNGGHVPIHQPVVEEDPGPTSESAKSGPIDDEEEPGPRTTTTLVFYALAGLTAVLGLWALISLFTG
jgi:hypothetical protein